MTKRRVGKSHYYTTQVDIARQLYGRDVAKKCNIIATSKVLSPKEKESKISSIMANARKRLSLTEGMR